MSKLTDKQNAFCEEHLIDLNATQATIRNQLVTGPAMLWIIAEP